jgi:PAS domain S-box-containing protein
MEVTYISPNVEEKIGMAADSIIDAPQSVIKNISKEDRKRIGTELANALKEKRIAQIEYEIKTDKGIRYWSRSRLSHRRIGKEEIIWTGISTDITEEVSMKNKVIEQKEHLKTLFEFASVGIATMSLNGVITAVNPAVSKITGYAKDEITGKHFKNIDIFYRKDLSFFLKLFNDAVRGKITEEKVVFEWKHKSGEKRWAEAYLNIVRNEGKVIGFQGVFMDATHRILFQQAELDKQRDTEFLFNAAAKLLTIDSEEKLFSFLTEQLKKLLPGIIINLNSIDDESRFLRVEAVKGVSGKIRSMILRLFDQNLVGRIFEVDYNTFDYAIHGKLLKVHDNLYDLALHQVPEKICMQIEKLIKLEEIYEISLGVGDKIMGGSVIFITKGQRIGNTSLIEILFRQASQALLRLRTRHRLTNSEELYRSLAENAGDLIMRVDEQMKPIYANQAFLKTFRFRPEEIIQKDLRHLGFPGTIHDLIESTIQITISNRKPQTCDIVINLGDKPIFYEWRMFPEYDEKKQVLSILVFVRDITGRKENEARLQENIEYKNRILALISHDLKNPFNSILGFLDLLKTEYSTLSDELKMNYINIIFESSTNLHNLLDSLQDWSHRFQEQSINPVYFDLQEMINRTMDVLQAQIQEKELIVYNSIPTGTIIKADYNMIYAAIRNILSNACKYSHKEGSITIHGQKQEDRIVINIKDDGVGMSEVEIQKLNNLEERFTKYGTMDEKGSGLGFRLANELIELNDGKLTLKSRPGKGCTVSIALKNH